VTTVPLIGCLLARSHDYKQLNRPPTTTVHQQLRHETNKQSSFFRSISAAHNPS